MATWAFYGYGDAPVSTAAGGSSAYAINTSSALSFGGGTRTSFQTNITLGSWNSALHYALDTSESSTDYCGGSVGHLHPIYPTNTFPGTADTGAVLDGAYVNMAAGTPLAVNGIGLRFTHSFGVKVSPINIWAGTSPGIAAGPQSAEIAICDLSTNQAPNWATVSPSSALALKTHAGAADEAEEHWWSVGISVKPTVVGHNGENVIRVEATYY